MSEQSPYEKLGVPLDASFDEIQDVRNRLLEQYKGDAKRLEMIEAAYDTILMDRLRMRQEGKIKVPERIRFPESRLQALPKENITSRKPGPKWLQSLLDQPSPKDILLPGLWYSGLSAVGIFYQTQGDEVLQLALVVGVGVGIYFLNRKEGKFGRAVLLVLIGLITGLIAGGLVASWLLSSLTIPIDITGHQFSTVLTFILLWAIASFFK